jgi:hypothetical protein
MTETNMYQRGETWFLRAEIAGRKYRESLHTSNVRDARRLRDARLRSLRRKLDTERSIGKRQSSHGPNMLTASCPPRRANGIS